MATPTSQSTGNFGRIQHPTYDRRFISPPVGASLELDLAGLDARKPRLLSG